MRWRKSSYSFSNGNCAEVVAWRTPRRSNSGHCAELAAWRKSSASIGNGECAEVGQGSAVVGVRDSKDPGGPVLAFGAAAWREFTGRLRGCM